MLQADAQHNPTHSPKELAALTIADLNTTINHEPRIRDLRIAERLGMADPHMIRRTIERNRTELETYGTVSVIVTETSDKGGRPGNEYWLNEPQTLLICMFSKTPNAAAVRREVIDVYLAYRRGDAGNSNATPAYLPMTDGRYVVRMSDRRVVSVMDATRHCLVDGQDPVSVLTFLNEYAAPDVFPAALDVVMRRMCFHAQNSKTGKYRDELLLAVARASAALTKHMDKSPDRLTRHPTHKQNQGRLC